MVVGWLRRGRRRGRDICRQVRRHRRRACDCVDASTLREHWDELAPRGGDRTAGVTVAVGTAGGGIVVRGPRLVAAAGLHAFVGTAGGGIVVRGPRLVGTAGLRVL